MNYIGFAFTIALVVAGILFNRQDFRELRKELIDVRKEIADFRLELTRDYVRKPGNEPNY